MTAVRKAYPTARRNDSEGGKGWQLVTPKSLTSFNGHATVESITIQQQSG